MAGRCLPIYLVLDTSGSMSGDPIEAVKQGVNALVAELLGEPWCLEAAYVSVITFDTDARQVCPLTDLMSFTPPELVASGGIPEVGKAIDVLTESINREVDNGDSWRKGDLKPIVVVATASTDGDWRPAFRRLAASPWDTSVLALDAVVQRVARDEGLAATTLRDQDVVSSFFARLLAAQAGIIPSFDRSRTTPSPRSPQISFSIRSLNRTSKATGASHPWPAADFPSISFLTPPAQCRVIPSKPSSRASTPWSPTCAATRRPSRPHTCR